MDYLGSISCMFGSRFARVSLTWLAIASTRVSGMSVSEAMTVAEESLSVYSNKLQDDFTRYCVKVLYFVDFLI